MNKIKISLNVASTHPTVPMNFKIVLDNQTVFDSPVLSQQTVCWEIDDTPQDHLLQLTMSGKEADHTKFDEHDNVIEDVMLQITDIKFDEILLTDIIDKISCYHHDYNGSSEPIKDLFFEHMGCNGTVEIAFSTPVYLWLLENM